MSMSSTNVSHHGHPPTTHRRNEGGPPWLSAVAGLCASLVGLGLARFAYTPLIPALITERWFNPVDAVYLGAANLAGYLAGALVARELGARAGAVRTLRAMMVLASLCCLACSKPVSFIWFFFWRFLAGLTGGVIMVLAASTILPHIAPAKRGAVGGVIFAGVGLGVAASGTLVPVGNHAGEAGNRRRSKSPVLCCGWRLRPEIERASLANAQRPLARAQFRSPRSPALPSGMES
jgi:MFS family permease